MIFPYSVWHCWWLAPCALLLDLWLGDPRLPWTHPVCILGNLMHKYERFARPFCRTAAGEKFAGILGVFLAASGSFLCIWLIVQIPFIGLILAIYFAWAGLAMGCLLSTGRQSCDILETGTLEDARKSVSMLVSRDVRQLPRPMLRKTLADTLSENFTDAFMAPFFWLVIAGPAGLWLYKAVSTLDSQWGYKTPVWNNFGWCAARCDDLLAWMPARISVIALWVAHKLSPVRHWHGSWPGFRHVLQDAKVMPSPNSGLPMAACAWLCGGRMAGPAVYFGELIDKSWLGPPHGHLWENGQIDALLKLMFRGTLSGGCLVWAFCILLIYLCS